MSINHLVWCWDNCQAGGTDLLMMLALADGYARRWPGEEHLARRCRISEEQARASVASLVDRGELTVDRDEGTFTINALDEHERERTAAQAEEERLSKERQRLEDARPLAYADGRWEGSWPLAPGDVCPSKGTHVVYWLYGEPRKLIYIGTSGQLSQRMAQHADTKTWVRWEARECYNRSQAYRLEAVEIDKHRPPLNKPVMARRGADFVASELAARTTRRPFVTVPVS